MGAPLDRHYSETHEWHRPDGDLIAIGLTRFAVNELTDITYVEITKNVGEMVQAGDNLGEIESVKATSEIYTGMDGKVVAVNEAVVQDPSLINTDPYGQGWLVKIQPARSEQFGELMDAAAYDEQYPSD